MDYDADFFRGGIPARFKGDEVYHEETDLNLTLSDIEDELEPMPGFMFILDERQAEDLALDGNSCCHKECSDKDWDANESTFISYLPEPDQSLDIIPFDQTFENMDAEMNESYLNSTKVLPHAYPRSRFISECAFDRSE